MSKRSYWLDLFTGTTWKEYKQAGGAVSGFRASRWNIVQKIKPGDYLLCYLTGISRFVGVLEVIAEPYKDTTPIWKDEDFPSRLKVKIVHELTPETAVPVFELHEKLSFFKEMPKPNYWTGHFRSSPNRFEVADGEAIVEAIAEAVRHPVVKPVDPKKLNYRPKALKAKIGQVVVPEDDEEEPEPGGKEPKKPTEHTEIQWHLLKLGSDMGFDVWVAKNDRNRTWDGQKLGEMAKLKQDLPAQFDEATNKTIELIDVLWLKGNAIVAAFEVESTTSIYSGLLRMSDLVAMQPNINIPLYLVAPDERREKVINEVNRPTFLKISPPLAEICRFISFSSLKEQVKAIGHFLSFIKPEFLEAISESCVIEEM